MVVLEIIFIIFCVLLIITFWVLLAPLVIFIDTRSRTFYVELTSLAGARILSDNNLFKIRVRILFIHFIIDPFKPTEKKIKKEKEKKEKRRKKKRAFSFRTGRKLATEMIRSFDAELRAEVDTGDVITNAYLLPTFIFLKCEGFDVSVNNRGINSVRAEIRNRLMTLLFIFIKYRIRNW